MPTYQFEAMDATGQEIRDEIDAANEEEARSMVDISCKKILANVIMEGYEFNLHQVETA